MSSIKIIKVLGGLQDLLLKGFRDATEAKSTKVQQERHGVKVEVNYLNIDTIPYVSSLGEPDYLSIRDYVDNAINNIVIPPAPITKSNISRVSFSNTQDLVVTNGITLHFTDTDIELQDSSTQEVIDSVITATSEVIAIFLNGISLPFIKDDSGDYSVVTDDLVWANTLYKKDIVCLVQ